MAFLISRLYRRLCQNEKEVIFLLSTFFPRERLKIKLKAFHSEVTRTPTKHRINWEKEKKNLKNPPTRLEGETIKTLNCCPAEGWAATLRLHTWCVLSNPQKKGGEAIFSRKLVTALQSHTKKQVKVILCCSFFLGKQHSGMRDARVQLLTQFMLYRVKREVHLQASCCHATFGSAAITSID